MKARTQKRTTPLTQAVSLTAAAALVCGLAPQVALAEPTPEREIAAITELDGPKTADELTASIIAGAGNVVDDDDFTSESSTRKSA